MINVSRVKQLKLVTGEEIMAEVVEEDDYDVFVRNVLAIQFHNLNDGSRMYTFKLFMCYQDDPERLLLIKIDKIVAIANPIQEMIEQYQSAVSSMIEDDEEDDFNETYKKMTALDSDGSNVVKFPKLH